MMICESNNESENNSSAHISIFEQRAYIKIETIRGKTVPEIHAALNEVCGTDTVDRSTVQRWHQRFRDGRISIDNNPRSGRPSTVTQDNTNAAILATLLDEDRRITVREIENETEIRNKRPGMLQNGVSILHDNARPHIGAPVVALLEKYGWERLKHPPYSPDLSPPNFDLFPKLKEPLRGIRFPNLDILNEEVSRRTRELNKDGVQEDRKQISKMTTQIHKNCSL
ncbi:Ribonuclease H-like domain [Cinara cedri]|uniref:Ribonuclease H-like domain n=1 Tax=Cinara cedri TaxID=506608 RepID=A0A5E4MXV1_9HEMI|nr:Ribonuclease H-like domain [Cinara cedri]